jgi:Tfp pilus assembly protein PilX
VKPYLQAVKLHPLRGNPESGVALITTLLVLSIMTLISLAMVLSVSSDMLINGYYQNFRGSFYAADSGLNIARQSLVTQIEAQIPSAFAIPPLPANATSTAVSNMLTTYGASYNSINGGVAAASWKESFTIPNSASCPSAFGLASGSPTVTSTDQYGNPTSYQYIYNYSVCSIGRSQGSEQEVVSENGSIILNVSGGVPNSTRSFADYGAFIYNYPPCLGALIPGTMTGAMFTNGAWQFETGGQYIFTDPVGQANADADYWFGGNCIQSPTTSDSFDGQTIAPQFQGSPAPGFQLGQQPIPLPQDAFSQEWAVLDGMGCGEGGNVCGNSQSPAPPSPTDVQMNATLKNVSGSPYPTTGATTGVYLPYSAENGSNTMTGGGIYVQGDAQVTLAPSGTSAEVYTITQGSTVTTVTVDPVANTTTMASGATSVVLSGVPENLTTTPASPETMIYVNGNITSLSGPGQGQPGIQNNTEVTVAAAQNITVTGDVLYSSEPVTTTQNQIPGTPADTLITANENNNEVLGMFTPGGNIILQSSYADNNLEVDGSLAATSSAPNMGGFLVNGYINTFNNVGGQIQYSIYGANMDTENTYFDRRFTARSNFAPPWFPATTVTTSAAVPISYNASVQRTQWLNPTAAQ